MKWRRFDFKDFLKALCTEVKVSEMIYEESVVVGWERCYNTRLSCIIYFINYKHYLSYQTLSLQYTCSRVPVPHFLFQIKGRCSPDLGLTSSWNHSPDRSQEYISNGEPRHNWHLEIVIIKTLILSPIVRSLQLQEIWQAEKRPVLDQ